MGEGRRRGKGMKEKRLGRDDGERREGVKRMREEMKGMREKRLGRGDNAGRRGV